MYIVYTVLANPTNVAFMPPSQQMRQADKHLPLKTIYLLRSGAVSKVEMRMLTACLLRIVSAPRCLVLHLAVLSCT